MSPNVDNETQGEIAGGAESVLLPGPPLQTREHPPALAGTIKVIRRLNRNTTWVAAGLLGPVVFAALMVALQEPHRKADDLTEGPRQIRGDLLLNADSAAPSNVVGSNGKSNGEIISRQATSVNHGLTLEINHPDVQAYASSWSPAQRQDTARVIPRKIPNARRRSSVRPRFVHVKIRLIAVWHQTLARNEKSRTWTPSRPRAKGKEESQ
jgi:hypothetical protein